VPISRTSVSAEKFSDKFVLLIYGPIYIQ
jgi:hypothetical protein